MKIRKIIKFLGFLILPACMAVHADAGVKDRPAGRIGIVLGAPTGMTVDFQVDRSNRLFSDLGIISDSTVWAGGWEHHFSSPIQVRNKKIRMQSLLGAGVHAHLNHGERFGIGPVIAQEMSFENSPFFVFVRLFPMVRLQPDGGFNLNANLGLVFSF